MANERFTGIGTTITAIRSGDVMAVDNLGPGSAQINTSFLNFPIDSGVFTLNSASATSFIVPFNYMLGAPPSRIRLNLQMNSTSSPMPGLGWVVNNTTNFTLCVTGPLGVTNLKVFWEALP